MNNLDDFPDAVEQDISENGLQVVDDGYFEESKSEVKSEQPKENKPKANHFIDNEEFMRELVKLKETDELSDRLHVIFFELARNYANVKSFRNYSYIQDMIVEGYINCVLMARKFDTEQYKNPFSYFTTTVHRNFVNFIAKEKKQQKRKWRELKVLYEKYMIEDGVELNLPADIMSKMYDDDEPKPKKNKPTIEVEEQTDEFEEAITT
jgi:DNA-directed RNA polymerase specialized sigma24 family protein